MTERGFRSSASFGKRQESRNKEGKNAGKFSIVFCNYNVAGQWLPRPKWKQYENAFHLIEPVPKDDSRAPSLRANRSNPGATHAALDRFVAALLAMRSVPRIYDSIPVRPRERHRAFDPAAMPPGSATAACRQGTSRPNALAQAQRFHSRRGMPRSAALRRCRPLRDKGRRREFARVSRPRPGVRAGVRPGTEARGCMACRYRLPDRW